MKQPFANSLKKLRQLKAIRSPSTWLRRPSRHLASASCTLRLTTSEKMPCSRASTILVGRCPTRMKSRPTNNAESKKPRGYLASRFLLKESNVAIQQVDPGMVPYQILDTEGKLVGKMPDLSAERLLALYRYMQLGRSFSNKIIALQRQGRATTFGSLAGQEATAVGLAAPMQPQDWLATSYREIASLMVKGMPLATLIYSFRGFTAENFPREIHCLPIQIVIGTQMPHAVGLAMAAKIAGDPVVAVGVCGDGATSEGDFNEALNFAGVFQAPVVLVVQNNGWPIRAPRHKQSAAATLPSP